MANQKLTVILQAVDRITAPIRGITSSTKRLTSALSAASARAGRIAGFQKLEAQTGQTAAKLDIARRRLGELGRQLKTTTSPSKQLQAQFNAQQALVKKLAGAHHGLVEKLKTERAALRAAGVDTRNLSDAQAAAERRVRWLGKALEWKHKIAERTARFQERLGRAAQFGANLSLMGQATSRVARGIFGAGRSLYASVADLDEARGALATLGMENIELVVQKGRDLAGRLAGVTATQFTAAAYDIKSGISTLTDEGVAQMTAAATITAKATRALPEEMTSLFATGHGIFKRQFKDLTDEGFGELFSASIAKSVQQFKTTGSAMQQAVQSMGAGATNLGMSLADQLTTLGMLQGVMKSGEAGTALRAFATNAARAHEELSGVGVDILDNDGQLRALPDILADLKRAYGDTLDAFEKQELKEAFGSDEVMKIIDALWGQEEAFRANAAAIRGAGDEGLAFTNKMAAAADKSPTARWTILMQKFDLLKEKIATVLIPEIDRLIPKVSAIFDSIGRWVQENKGVIISVGKLALIVGIAAAVITPLILGLSLLSGVFGAVSGVISIASFGLSVLGKTIGLVSLLATPLALKIALVVGIIGALAAGGYLVYKNWEPIWNWLINRVNDFKRAFAAGVVWLLEKIQAISDALPPWLKEKTGFSIDLSDTIASFKAMDQPPLPVEFRLPSFDEALADMGLDNLPEKLTGKLKEKFAGLMPSMPEMPDIGDLGKLMPALPQPKQAAAGAVLMAAAAGAPAAVSPVTVHQNNTITIQVPAGGNAQEIADVLRRELDAANRNAVVAARAAYD